MPKFYPKELIEETRKRINKGWDIHTLVLITKHPRSILAEPLKSFLLDLQERKIQLFVHLTITGLGSLIIGKN